MRLPAPRWASRLTGRTTNGPIGGDEGFAVRLQPGGVGEVGLGGGGVEDDVDVGEAVHGDQAVHAVVGGGHLEAAGDRRDRLDAHRELLERVAASWPDDAPYMAEEVRRILAGEDD
ncbi:hypothetical protein ACWEPL_40015 [Nonomuraea sp. NPDC004186]